MSEPIVYTGPLAAVTNLVAGESVSGHSSTLKGARLPAPA